MQAPGAIFLTKSDGSDRRKTAESGRETVIAPKGLHYVIGPAGIWEVETRRPLEETTAANGESHHEVDRLHGSARALKSSKSILFAVTVAAHHLVIAEIRRLVDEFIRQLEVEMDRAGAPRRYWLLAWHVGDRDRGEMPHVHLTVAFPAGEGRRRLSRLQRRSTFTRHDRLPHTRCMDFSPVTDLKMWTDYQAAERTPQANYGDRKEWRRRGSFHLEGGGDRVRLSAHLRDDAIEHGWVRDWKATNARRSETRKPRRSATAVHVSAVVPHLDRYGGMLFPLPVAHAPSRQPTAPKPRRPGGDRQVEQGTLPLQSGNIELLDVLRHLGRTDAERAAAIGLSRPTVNNVRHGRFGLSREAARRILAEARSRGLAA